MNVVNTIKGFVEKNADIVKIIVLIALIGAIAYFAKCGFKRENLFMEFASNEPKDGKYVPNITGDKTEGAKDYKDMFYGGANAKSESKDVEPIDLLPKTELDGELADDVQILQGNFINAGLDYPVDTVGGQLKKLNYSLRSVPQIPANRDLSPFMMSSWEADQYSKPLE